MCPEKSYVIEPVIITSRLCSYWLSGQMQLISLVCKAFTDLNCKLSHLFISWQQDKNGGIVHIFNLNLYLDDYEKCSGLSALNCKCEMSLWINVHNIMWGSCIIYLSTVAVVIHLYIESWKTGCGCTTLSAGEEQSAWPRWRCKVYNKSPPTGRVVGSTASFHFPAMKSELPELKQSDTEKHRSQIEFLLREIASSWAIKSDGIIYL